MCRRGRTTPQTTFPPSPRRRRDAPCSAAAPSPTPSAAAPRAPRTPATSPKKERKRTRERKGRKRKRKIALGAHRHRPRLRHVMHRHFLWPRPSRVPRVRRFRAKRVCDCLVRSGRFVVCRPREDGARCMLRHRTTTVSPAPGSPLSSPRPTVILMSRNSPASGHPRCQLWWGRGAPRSQTKTRRQQRRRWRWRRRRRRRRRRRTRRRTALVVSARRVPPRPGMEGRWGQTTVGTGHRVVSMPRMTR